MSKNKSIKAASNTGNDNKLRTAVNRNDHIVNGSLLRVMPTVRLLIIVEIKLIAVSAVETIKKIMLMIHKLIPSPEPVEASDNALSGGYAVHPDDAVPVSRKNEYNMITPEIKNNQYESMFINPEAMSRAPI